MFSIIVFFFFLNIFDCLFDTYHFFCFLLLLLLLLLLNALLKSRNYRVLFSGFRHQILSESFMRLG